MNRSFMVETVKKVARSMLEKNASNKGHGYVGMKVHPEDAKKLHAIASSLGVSDLIDTNKMHLTIIYDESHPEISNYEPSKKTYECKVTDVKNLGEKDSKWYAICLDLEAPELAIRHKNLRAMGFGHSYENFTPHVSIKYKPSESDSETLKKNLKTIQEGLPTIRLYEEYTEKLSDP